MASVKVRNLEIGEGMPKICVPIVGKTVGEICDAAKKIAETSADLVEWRVDWFEDIFDFDKVTEVLYTLRGILGELPILFTCRTEAEGGEIRLTERQYVALNQSAIESGYIDLIDVEVFGFADQVKELAAKAHEHDVKVIGSNHDFQATPSKEEIIRRILDMQKAGIDIPKIAVMPQDAKDVLILLEATEEIAREHGSTPIVTMSMGALGSVSRITGHIFGSAITFGMVGSASAPGQIEVNELKKMMKILR